MTAQLAQAHTLAPLTLAQVYALAQSPDVSAAAAAAREIEARMAASIERYRSAHRALAVRVTRAQDASGAAVGTIERAGRGAYTAQPVGSMARVSFERHSDALEWLRTLAYLAR